MSEDIERQTKSTSDFLTIINSFIQLLMLLTVMTIAILRFINTRSQLKTNDLKNEYFMNKNKKKWKMYTV
jgi:hypothetical protein